MKSTRVSIIVPNWNRLADMAVQACRGFLSRMGILGELLVFLWKHKLCG
jgi:hypothetical protein